MALDVRSLETDEPPMLHVVDSTPQSVVDDPLGEEFGFPQNRKAVRTPKPPRAGRRGRLLPFLLVICVGAAGLFVVRTLGAGDDAPEPAATAAPSAPAATAAPSAPPVAAPAQPAGVPMSVLSPRLVAAAPQTYRALVSVRNPTDVPAADVTVTLTVKDAGGRVLRTDMRVVEFLPSGRTVDVEFTGEFGAGTAVPATVDVKAAAARLISPSV